MSLVRPNTTCSIHLPSGVLISSDNPCRITGLAYQWARIRKQDRWPDIKFFKPVPQEVIPVPYRTLAFITGATSPTITHVIELEPEEDVIDSLSNAPGLAIQPFSLITGYILRVPDSSGTNYKIILAAMHDKGGDQVKTCYCTRMLPVWTGDVTIRP